MKQEIFHTQFSCIIMQIGSWFGHIQTIFAKCNTFWVSYLIDYEQKIPLSYERSYHNHWHIAWLQVFNHIISLTQGKVQGWSAIGLFFMGIKHFLAYRILCKKMPLISVPCQAVKLLPVSSLCLFRTAFVSSVVKRITLDVSDVGILIHLKFFCAAHC